MYENGSASWRTLPGAKNIILLNYNPTPVSRCSITNGLMIELIRFATCQKRPMKAVLKRLKLLCGKNWPKYPPKNDILVYQEKAVQEKEQALAKKRRQKEQKLALCDKISNSGFWMSPEDALASLSKLPNETKKK